ncbi:hypothetical protein HYZ78_03895 [Candidatus Microgenomates bacterium]|nr:hypothetical protein [Candidatus Microgenomates bacterium]
MPRQERGNTLSLSKGFAHVVLLLAVVVIVIAVLVYTGVIKVPSLPFLSKAPKVELETKYENPFKKETQYVNPFDSYKNPFVVNR